MKVASKEVELPTVAAGPGQGREARSHWAWTEPAVWTERMLTALEDGVKGGVWAANWPNAYFAEQGLFSLATAHVTACRSR